MLAVLALSLSACGASSTSSHTSGSAAANAGAGASASPTSTSAVASTSEATGGVKASGSGAGGSHTAGSTASAQTNTTTAPPPVPSGTPGAPDGLRPTTGYATYELCSSGCSGSVPSALRRPLHLPHLAAGARCRVSPPNGPVAPLGGQSLAVASFIGSSWSGSRVTWTAAPSYGGPVLIRGRQLGGGGGAVGFGEGHVPYDELQLLASGQGSPGGRGRAWLTITRVKGPGCYAYQVDGTSLSEVIVFEAVG